MSQSYLLMRVTEVSVLLFRLNETVIMINIAFGYFR